MSSSPPCPSAAQAARVRIVVAAAGLLADGEREAPSTRAVCTAAGVQAPTIHRICGDEQGLLDAVAAHGSSTCLAPTTDREAGDDSLAELRTGWDPHVSSARPTPTCTP